jgi:hypothetical protein
MHAHGTGGRVRDVITATVLALRADVILQAVRATA